MKDVKIIPTLAILEGKMSRSATRIGTICACLLTMVATLSRRMVISFLQLLGAHVYRIAKTTISVNFSEEILYRSYYR